MTPTIRGALVERVVDAIKAAHPGTPSKAIAAVAGCAPSDLSRFKSGERKMDLDELVALVDEYGPVAVLGPIAARGHCDVVARDAAPTPVMSGSVHLVETAATFIGEAARALADGRLSAEERDRLSQQLYRISAVIAGLHASLDGAGR